MTSKRSRPNVSAQSATLFKPERINSPGIVELARKLA